MSILLLNLPNQNNTIFFVIFERKRAKIRNIWYHYGLTVGKTKWTKYCHEIMIYTLMWIIGIEKNNGNYNNNPYETYRTIQFYGTLYPTHIKAEHYKWVLQLNTWACRSKHIAILLYRWKRNVKMYVNIFI